MLGHPVAERAELVHDESHDLQRAVERGAELVAHAGRASQTGPHGLEHLKELAGHGLDATDETCHRVAETREQVHGRLHGAGRHETVDEVADVALGGGERVHGLSAQIKEEPQYRVVLLDAERA